MNRDQVIAKTLQDMRHHVQGAQQQKSDRDEYDREVTIPELMRRLPDGEVATCEEFDFDVDCCDSCHYFYAHYDMYLVDLPDGRKAWICCAVRSALLHEPKESDYSQEVDL